VTFNSLPFAVLFGLTLGALAILRGVRAKQICILVASLLFYAWWDWRFLALLVGLAVVNHWAGAAVSRTVETRARKLLVGAAVAFDLGLLGLFKYYGFFVESLSHLGLTAPSLNLVLPIGISFMTFEVISYVVDVYRGDAPADTLLDVLLLVCFFPHLVSGPILKPREFLPQLRKDNRITAAGLDAGLQQFLAGLVKKTLIADRLALFVDPVFKQPSLYSSATLWLAALAYTLQIYYDFSGYTDMAIGAARCMGYEIPPNFAHPYLSKSITEFWRRWHISLSTWLREYIYFPLGGNRKGAARQYVNLSIVMLLGGLWHGASWHFVVWGGLHGAALAFHKFWADRVRPKRWTESGIYSAVAWATTFLFVVLTWVVFRASSVTAALGILARLAAPSLADGIAWYPPSLAVIVPIAIATHVASRFRPEGWRVRPGSFSGAFVIAFALLALVLVRPLVTSPFIYFQF
jgi:alginate O-acetyltransferase complex protein AlgI